MPTWHEMTPQERDAYRAALEAGAAREERPEAAETDRYPCCECCDNCGDDHAEPCEGGCNDEAARDGE